MAEVECVLLGVAEVKVPVKRLPQETLTRVAEVAEWAVIHEGHEATPTTDFLADRENFIGEVDDYYALREVKVTLDEEKHECRLVHVDKNILQHRVRDVALVATFESNLRVVYISKSDSFGRMAVVLQLGSKETVEQLYALFPKSAQPPPIISPNSNGVQTGVAKDHKSSIGRSVGKLTTMFMASLSASTNIAANAFATASVPKRSPMPRRKQSFKTIEQQNSTNSDSDSSSEDESVSDDTDSKSAGNYYEDIGLDANVQERLYDAQSCDSVSRLSDTSIETNALIIEAELKFFLDTDSDFLKSLKSLNEAREQLTTSNTPQLLRGKVILLFSQVTALTDMHIDLHEDFEKSNGNLQKLSEAITSRRNSYEKYVYFMENIPVVDDILEAHKDYFKEHMPTLPENLRKPRMRLHYYVLTLETLYKKSSCAEDRTALQTAIDVLKAPLKKADSNLFLGAVVGSPFDLSNFGDVLRHNDLSLRRGGDLSRRVYHVLLLKTLILLTTRNGRNYCYVTSFRMDQVGLGTQERGLIFDLKVRGPRGQTVVYVFKAKNINLQQQWINSLKDILRDKSYPSTPRNSYIEVDNDIRLSGKRNRMCRESSSEKLTSAIISMTTVPSSPINREELDGVTINSPNLRSGRRGAIKKSSSTNSKNHPVVRHYSSASDTESSWNRRRMVDQPIALNIWTQFPELKSFYYQQTESIRTSGDTPAYVEKEYVEGLRTILGTLLDEKVPKPPHSISTLLRRLIQFHSDVFLPVMEKASSRAEVAQCFIDCATVLKEHYSCYFVELTRHCEELKFNATLDMYRLPLDHFIDHVKMLSTYQLREKNVVPSVHGALSILRECVSDANGLLLTKSIQGAPFDLHEHAPVLYEGSAKVRWTGIMMKQDYHLALLESMLLLLEPHSAFTYRYVDALRMDTVGLGPLPDKHTFQLEVRTAATRTVLYTFRTPNSEAAEKWVAAIIKLLNLQMERLKEKVNRRFGSDPREMVVVRDPDLVHENHILETDL